MRFSARDCSPLAAGPDSPRSRGGSARATWAWTLTLAYRLSTSVLVTAVRIALFASRSELVFDQLSALSTWRLAKTAKIATTTRMVARATRPRTVQRRPAGRCAEEAEAMV